MTPLERALLRVLGVWAVLAGVELLERVAYRAGVADTSEAAADAIVAALTDVEDLADELTAFDASDVIAAHLDAAAGECVCCLSGATTGPPA